MRSTHPAAYPRLTCESCSPVKRQRWSALMVAALAMTSVVRDKWPLYVVTQYFSSRLPIQLDKLVLVTSSPVGMLLPWTVMSQLV